MTRAPRMTLAELIAGDWRQRPLWASDYKIPWNDPEFSRRMLAEHLSQEHDMASRRRQSIERQAEWIHKRFLAVASERPSDRARTRDGRCPSDLAAASSIITDAPSATMPRDTHATMPDGTHANASVTTSATVSTTTFDDAPNGAARASALDLGCGPGLYAPALRRHGHAYLGVDFGPASIAHARQRNELSADCAFILGDLLETPFLDPRRPVPHDLVMLLYGEFNVFPPRDAERILAKAHAALKPGGVLLLEVHTFEAVQTLGEGTSWFGSPQSLFGDAPHLSLTENQWFAEEGVARQHFFVLDAATAEVESMCSTTKAWTDGEYRRLLGDAGFEDVRFEADWPEGREEFILISARKPGS